MELNSAIINTILNKKILIISVIFLILPLDILQVSDQQSGLPLCLLLLPFGIFFFFKKDIVLDKFYFWLTFVLSFISILYISTTYKTFTYKSSLSLIYFLLPSLGYFIAIGLIKTLNDFILFLKITVILTFLLSLSLFYSIFIINNGFVRYEGTLEGTFYGLKLSGAYGIHSLGAHYFFLINFIVLYLEFVKKRTKFMTAISLFSILMLTYIIVLSLSRELVLAMIIFFISYLVIKYKIIKTVIWIASLSFVIFIFGKSLINTVYEAWEYKLYLSTSSSSLNELSSGRLDLQELAITQILNNPIFATGFNGYTLNYLSYKGYDNLEGWSTHIYFLTSLWKMGLLAFTAYILFWTNIFKKMFKNNYSIDNSTKKIIILFIMNTMFINLFWDALLAPNIMALFSFFCGSIVIINKNDQVIIDNKIN